MQRPQREITLNDILITEELSRRSPRSPNWQAEAQAMQPLARQMARDPESLMQTLADIALELCQAGTAGVSLLETTPNGSEIFRWNVLAGTLAPHVGGSTPRDFSPCGVCLDRGTPQLFSHPERYFTYFQAANTPIVEGLVLPLIADDRALGTLWVMSHDEQRHFDCEDVRVMTSLADFTAATLLLNQRQTRELLAANAALEAEIAERKQAEERSRALIENLPGGAAFVVDRNFRYLLAEGEALSAAGFKPEDFVGKTIFEVLPPELVVNYEVLYRQALAGELFEQEHNAHDRTYISRGTPLRSLNGEVYAVLAVSYDISDRKRAEETLRESEEKFRTFVSATSDIIYEMSADWREMRSLKGKEFIATTENPRSDWTEAYIPETDKPRVWAAIDRAIATRSNFELQHRVIRLDGTVGWTFSRAIPLMNETGEIVKWFGAATDITDRKHAEAALRASEAKYRTLFDSIDEGFCIIELIYDETGKPIDWLFLEANSTFEQQTGFYAPGKTIRELIGKAEAFWLETYARVVETGKPERVENRVEIIDRWYNIFASRIDGADSRQLAIVFDDITDRKRVEAQLRRAAEMDAFRVKLSDALRSLSDPVQIQAEACRLLGEQLGVDRAYYAEVNEAENYTRINQNYLRGDSPSLVCTLPLTDYGWVLPYLQRGKTVVVPDIENSDIVPVCDRAAMAAIEVAAHISLPLIKGETLVGALNVTESKPRQWSEWDIELVRETADRLWATIERARVEADLRESEEKYRSLFETMGQGYVLCEMIRDAEGRAVDYRVIELNPAFERLTGISASEARGRNAREMVPRLEDWWVETMDRIVRSGEPERIEQEMGLIGSWFESNIYPQGGDRFIVLFDNITERKLNEQRREFILKLSDALRPLTDPIASQEVAVRMLGTHLGVDRCYYAEFDWTRDVLYIHHEYTQSGAVSAIGAHPIGAFNDLLVHSHKGEPLVCDDIMTHPVFGREAAAYRERGTDAFILMPLVKRGTMVACMCVTMENSRSWSSAEIALVEEVAERTWAAVERARAEDAARESEIQRIREQAAREEERQRAEALAELDRAKTLFFSNVSHEFRTPLTLLLAPLQDALSDRVNPLAPQQRERLELAHRNATRLLKLVNTLLDFSRIEAGRMEAVYEPTDLAMFTSELASVFRSAVEQAGLRLAVDCSPLPQPVYLDREMWEKIVINLLSNAFKFTLEGEIAVRLHPIQGDRVMLQIQDTGTGIPPEELPHLFERFYQVRGAKARTHEGSGIGLALVQELIRMHGGTVDVSSAVGQGTCFTVTIPFGTEHLPSDRLRLDVGDRNTTRTLASTALGTAPYVAEAERWLPAEGGSVEFSVLSSELEANSLTQNSKFFTRNSQTARILIVDDNADMRDYLTRILGDRFQVEAVADGAAALAAARSRVPDLVLSDVMMPHLDGFGLLQALRADPQTREIPIILLSARAGEESVVSGLQAGADDYLIKPFSAAELVSRVNAHLQMVQLRTQALRFERTTSRRKDELLSTVSHELNTPLVAILGWTRLLRSSPPSQSMLMKSLETIERNAELQAKLIQDLLDISRIEAGKVRLSLEPVELKSVIENAIAAVLTAAIAKNIHLEWQHSWVQEASEIIIRGDRLRLQQVICNLLTNAIKFTPAGGQVEISLKTIGSSLDVLEAGSRGAEETSPTTNYQLPITNYQLPTTQQAQITISDTGIGISADFLPHVFDRFRQAESPDSAKGLGLGLAIARHLVELHNGTIHAESLGVGLGATFTVGLPIVQKL